MDFNFSNEINKLDQSACKMYGSRVVFKNFKELNKLKKNKILILYTEKFQKIQNH